MFRVRVETNGTVCNVVSAGQFNKFNSQVYNQLLRWNAILTSNRKP